MEGSSPFDFSGQTQSQCEFTAGNKMGLADSGVCARVLVILLVVTEEGTEVRVGVEETKEDRGTTAKCEEDKEAGCKFAPLRRDSEVERVCRAEAKLSLRQALQSRSSAFIFSQNLCSSDRVVELQYRGPAGACARPNESLSIFN
ncbi:unnamed protein product [Pleuronectes platessa]|uniref:Uncharacterized protein n=1 Tax=Pleuronectes platessa TaxID=8262 RepID=A0A9N7YRZ6_PLEPL|nr:unnamed protein product [Pleuronectes platessa]